MPIRKIQKLGSSGDGSTWGISLDRGDLERDGVLEELEDGAEVRASLDRRGPGRYEVVILGIEEEPPAPTAD